MRASGDWQDYSLTLREGEDWGAGHVAWLVETESELETFQDRIVGWRRAVVSLRGPVSGRAVRCPVLGKHKRLVRRRATPR
jgi:hypothetical protein